MKKIFFIILLCLTGITVRAEGTQTTPPAVTYSQAVPNPVEYAACVKDYPMPSAELFQRTLSAISSSNYKIIEIQSTSSRVLFSVFGREFWASVTNQSSAASSLRILPADNSFYFRKDLVERIFSEIEPYRVQKIKKVY